MIKKILVFLILTASPALASDVVLYDPSSPYERLWAVRPSNLVRAAVNLFLGFSGVIAFIFLLWGGVQWIMSGSDKEALDRARRRIINALIGLAIVLSSYALLFIIEVLFDVNLISFTITNI